MITNELEMYPQAIKLFIKVLSVPNLDDRVSSKMTNSF